ncbi:hypothetical protein [Microbulbifer sp. SAOS-129_SWC]|uniref:hypothetical protein n=1 Tax=Microbulbifer sp. SAOS-129_SWC TaxID=3145235 RepID=UPI003217F4D9
MSGLILASTYGARPGIATRGSAIWQLLLWKIVTQLAGDAVPVIPDSHNQENGGADQ